MDFRQDEMHEELQTMYREFAQEQVKPLAAEIDKTERFPEETVAAMTESVRNKIRKKIFPKSNFMLISFLCTFFNPLQR